MVKVRTGVAGNASPQPRLTHCAARCVRQTVNHRREPVANPAARLSVLLLGAESAAAQALEASSIK